MVYNGLFAHCNNNNVTWGYAEGHKTKKGIKKKKESLTPILNHEQYFGITSTLESQVLFYLQRRKKKTSLVIILVLSE